MTNSVSDEVIEAEVPIIVEKVITTQISPVLIPVSSTTTTIRGLLKDFMS